MIKIVILFIFDKDELNNVLKKQKKVFKDKERYAYFEKMNNLLFRILLFSKYQLMKIEYRAFVNHFFENIFFISYSIFDLI